MMVRPMPLACAILTSLLLASCGPQAQPTGDDHHDDHDGHTHGPGGEHVEPSDSHDAHDGPVVDLGAAAIGAFNASATRDAGAITPGGEVAIDLTINSSQVANRSIAAVRFWVGLEDGEGSVRARAEIENPAEPNRWHTHAEVPSPLPDGSMLWVEIEDDQGTLYAGSFPLNPAG